MNVLDRNGVVFDPIWMAEFRGFFAGEGSLAVQLIHKKTNTLFRPRCRISLRLDDHFILDEFRDRIGGSLFFTKNQSSAGSPTLTWDANSLSQSKIISGILQNSVLPAKKFDQVPLWCEAICILDQKQDSGYGWGGRRISEESRTRLHEISTLLKQYKICKVQLSSSNQIISV